FKGGVKSGGNRFIGTVIGGLMAIPFYPLYHKEPFGIPGIVYLIAGLFLTLYINQIFNTQDSIQPGTVVLFVVILTVSSNAYVSYTINRMIDTGVGVLMSLFINKLFPPPLDKEKLQTLEE
ncbi:MAG: FUSC family protein, partial [Oscillospiraceae bacterium]